MPRALALFTAVALLVSGCGADEDSPEVGDDTETDVTAPTGPLAKCSDGLDGITVTGDAGTKPTVEFAQPFTVTATECTVLVEGTGEAAAEGDTVIFDFVFVNGRDGSEFGSSYAAGAKANVVLNDQLLRGVRQALLGQQGGARVLVAVAPEDGYGLRGGQPEQGLEADDTLLLVADITEVRRPLKRAEGAAVTPASGLPTVELGEDGQPTITVPEGEPPTELVVQPLIEGTGPVVATGQTITVHYTGVLFKDGTEFDSSWDGTPVNFPIGTGGVIAGWDKGLVGQKVGSQILLVIPPVDGYGAEGAPNAGISGTDTLVFVVDILDARVG